MPDIPASPKIGTLPDGRSYVTVPSGKHQRREFWQTLVMSALLVGVVVACYGLNKIVPEGAWGNRFLNNLCLSTFSTSSPWLWYWVPFAILQNMIKKVSPLRLRLWWHEGLLVLGLGVVAFVISFDCAPTGEAFGILNGALITFMGGVTGHLLRSANIKATFASIVDPSRPLWRRAGTVALCVAAVMLGVVALNYVVFQAAWRTFSIALWGYIALLLWGILVSRLAQDRRRLNVAEIPA